MAVILPPQDRHGKKGMFSGFLVLKTMVVFIGIEVNRIGKTEIEQEVWSIG